MAAMFQTTREWALTACMAVLLLYAILQPVFGIELYPVLDFKGGNQMNMQVDKDPAKGLSYHCGDIVHARFNFQKQRAIVGLIKWQLVESKPNGRILLYPARHAAAPIGIIDHWAPVETLPGVCEPGQYHFEGTITYPLLFGNVTYNLRTACFEVNP